MSAVMTDSTQPEEREREPLSLRVLRAIRNSARARRRLADYANSARLGMPSWWEAQGFSGTADDLERIRAAYTPYLPLPPVGIHRETATALGIEPRAVYRGIRKIRALMGLAQDNTPETHSVPPAVVAPTDPGEDAAQV